MLSTLLELAGLACLVAAVTVGLGLVAGLAAGGLALLVCGVAADGAEPFKALKTIRRGR